MTKVLLNAATRLQAGEVIAPSESYRSENKRDLRDQQNDLQHDSKERRNEQQKETSIESASTPDSLSPADTADVMYAAKQSAPLFAHIRLLADRLMTEDDPLTTDMENACMADSTTMTENPFPVEHDAESTHEDNTAVEVVDCRASATHDWPMMLQADDVLADSTHGMDKFKLSEHQPQDSVSEIEEAISTHGGNTALGRLFASANSTAQDNVVPVYRSVGDDVDENYLNVRGTQHEQNADTDPAMFGNGEQPLGGIGG